MDARKLLFIIPSRRAAVLAGLLCISSCPCVRAGGFTQPQGKGLVILTTSWTLAALAFDAKGAPVFGSRILKREANTYAEYGLTDWLTGIVETTLSDRYATSVIASRYATTIISDRYSGLDVGALGARMRLAQLGPISFAAEGNVRLSGATDRYRLAQAGHTGIETDIRLQAAAGFNLWSWPGYVDVSVGYRTRAAGPADEYRADVTLGIRPRQRWLWLLQSFNSFSAGGGGYGYRRIREHKLVTSAVYDINNRWSVQGGTIGTFAGKNVPRDAGAFVAVWYRF